MPNLTWFCMQVCSLSCRSVPKSNPTMCQKIIPAICSRPQREQESLGSMTNKHITGKKIKKRNNRFQAKQHSSIDGTAS
ncbi:hypothetical protein BO83DRAFT_59358 [Aspergillus eucalypticola CBS 122712]|uniref:Uncharacterized protein n=1 Tax=Aspergillus eucalypticola (strain CBS 122712 / IBT 29274) TaxID=1448314 RepID=A0A317VBV6_ASPEC|nr:uncharacterized protein BO83DRAFT_59358 [Aspergillus eucalypticola CBS 122712]PWY70721.1 hypothetical protein BO83DRAFT_59358 [Aspergillus eucalypticola CBS 122712]